MQAAGTYQSYLRSETLRVVAPYIGLGAIVLFWAVLIARTPFPHVGLDYTASEAAGDHGPRRGYARSRDGVRGTGWRG